LKASVASIINLSALVVVVDEHFFTYCPISSNCFIIGILSFRYGSFLNFDVLCNYLINDENDLILLCAGWKNRYNLEDTLFAGAVVNEIEQHFFSDCDSALSAKLLYETNNNNLEELVRKSSHANRFKLLHLNTDDVSFCLQFNKAPVLPILDGNYFKI
jgi:2-phosphosulfolactate phosphatase